LPRNTADKAAQSEPEPEVSFEEYRSNLGGKVTPAQWLIYVLRFQPHRISNPKDVLACRRLLLTSKARVVNGIRETPEEVWARIEAQQWKAGDGSPTVAKKPKGERR
jgi:hypothetical protein